MPDPHQRLAGVLEDLREESAQLDALVGQLPDDGWRTPTPADGWSVAHQVAHLAWTDEVAAAAIADETAWQQVLTAARSDPAGFVDRAAAEGAAAAPTSLLDRWRRARAALAAALREQPSTRKVPWFGPPMSATSMATARFMETWAHGLDVAEALGHVAAPTCRIRHVVHLGVRTRDFAFAAHGLPAPAEPFRVTLAAPDGAVWSYGPVDARQSVRGSAYDFCLLVTQRRHRDDLDVVARGADARRWLEIAQAFAGPPGPGRPRSASAVAPR